MRKCPNCGNDVSENSRFCIMCGHALTNSDEPAVPQNTPVHPEQPQDYQQPPQQEQTQDYQQPPQQEQIQDYQQTPEPQQPQDYQQVPPQYQQQNYQQVPPQYQQQNYQQVPPQYQQQNYQLYPPQYVIPPKKKHRWVLPVVIIAVIAVLAIAAILVLPKIFKPNTPETAVNNAITEMKTQVKSSIPNLIMDNMPSELNAYKDDLKSFMTDISDIVVDSIEYKVVDSRINGDNASVTVEFSIPDFENMSESDIIGLGMSMITGKLPEKFKELMNSCGTITETIEIDAHKENGKWVADMPDKLKEALDDLQDFI